MISCINIVRIVILKRSGKEMVGWFIYQCVILILQIQLEGFSWQLILLYGLPIIWIGYYKTSLKLTFGVFMVGCFFMTSLLLMLFPEPELDEPSGKYIVGTTTIYLIDELRQREIPTQIWYPSLSNEGKIPLKWFETQELVSVVAEQYHMKPFMLSQIEDVKSHAYKDTKVLEGKHPVILLSQDVLSSKYFHIGVIENLVSHGYIVVTPEYPKISTLTALHTGELVPHQSVADETFVMTLYQEDIAFVMERLNALNEKNKVLYHSMDLKRVGFLGHGMGAGAQVGYLMNENVQAFIAMDPLLEPLEMIQEVNTPIVILRSEDWMGAEDEDLKILVDEVIQPNHSHHFDFTDAFRLTPVLSITGYTSGQSYDAINERILRYFDEHLKKIKENYIDDMPVVKVR